MNRHGNVMSSYDSLELFGGEFLVLLLKPDELRHTDRGVGRVLSLLVSEG